MAAVVGLQRCSGFRQETRLPTWVGIPAGGTGSQRRVGLDGDLRDQVPTGVGVASPTGMGSGALLSTLDAQHSTSSERGITCLGKVGLGLSEPSAVGTPLPDHSRNLSHGRPQRIRHRGIERTGSHSGSWAS